MSACAQVIACEQVHLVSYLRHILGGGAAICEPARRMGRGKVNSHGGRVNGQERWEAAHMPRRSEGSLHPSLVFSWLHLTEVYHFSDNLM